MKIIGKVVTHDAVTATEAAPGKLHPVGDADFVLINHKCAGTTSCVWEFYTQCQNWGATETWNGLDTTFPPDPAAGEHTTTQAANEAPLLFDVRGCDAWGVRLKTRTAGDETFDAMGTLVKVSG